MKNKFTDDFSDHINFSYTCFDRLVLRGYIPLRIAEPLPTKKLQPKQGRSLPKCISRKRDRLCNKFVSHYYIYFQDETLGLCYLIIASYLPFPCEFYINVHNYLKQQFDIQQQGYKMKDNSFTQIDNLKLLETLVSTFQPSIALDRIDYWMRLFFRFNKGQKSTRSKLLSHKWYTSQTEISTNIIFKSSKFANTFFQRALNKRHTIGLPDRLTEIFGLKKVIKTS